MQTFSFCWASPVEDINILCLTFGGSGLLDLSVTSDPNDRTTCFNYWLIGLTLMPLFWVGFCSASTLRSKTSTLAVISQKIFYSPMHAWCPQGFKIISPEFYGTVLFCIRSFPFWHGHHLFRKILYYFNITHPVSANGTQKYFAQDHNYELSLQHIRLGKMPQGCTEMMNECETKPQSSIKKYIAKWENTAQNTVTFHQSL